MWVSICTNNKRFDIEFHRDWLGFSFDKSANYRWLALGFIYISYQSGDVAT